MDRYCKRLIEVDLPIKLISANARREKSIGHISSLHIWWARRPLAACRAVTCATLWLDPEDKLCPNTFRDKAKDQMEKWANEHLNLASEDTAYRFLAIKKNSSILDSNEILRKALLDFISDFSNWKNALRPEFISTSQELTTAAHESLGGINGSRPVVLDPFAGGGSIPVEALRVGAESFASDLNPIPYFLNKVLIDYIPRYKEALEENFIKAADWISTRTRKDLTKFYPLASNNRTPIAYLWARTIHCEGPNCGVEIPILRSLWLEKKGANRSYLELRSSSKKGEKFVDISIVKSAKGSSPSEGTVKRATVTCPICSYTVPRPRLQDLGCQGKLGERLVVIVSTKQGERGRVYEVPSETALEAISEAESEIAKTIKNERNDIPLIPSEKLPYLSGTFNVHIYGMDTWSSLFNPRQLLSCITFVKTINELREYLLREGESNDLVEATILLTALTIDRQINALNKTCYWNSTGAKMQAGFARQAIPMFWDYCEANPFGGSVGTWASMIKCAQRSFDALKGVDGIGTVQIASATQHPLPDDSVDAVITDPPYYDAVPYADLSDFFYVWLKRMIGSQYPEIFSADGTPKKMEIVQLAEKNPIYSYKTKKNFEDLMTTAMSEARRIAKPSSASVVVFAHQTTAGWETMLESLIQAGWIVTASWPIDTEMPTRVRAKNSAVLASSIHLVCRPRENPDGSLRADDVGDWREVLEQLPKRIHLWMPRLAEEGVVGADAIFACLGPALEIFSQYSSVEKANGEKVGLKKYLEEVWAAVSREALNMIFKGADASGFEEDARLTAMWLWTLRTATNGGEEEADEGEKTKSLPGYSLEYDAARKIAQGLGVHLENLSHLVEIKGDTAMLLSAGTRSRYLFGKDSTEVPSTGKKKKKAKQQTFFDFEEDIKLIEAKSNDWVGEIGARSDLTILDQLHQSMILFAAGRSEVMKRLLVEEGVGQNPQFWKLAQAFSALYSAGTDEKRWVDGVLARKKGLGF
jgi:putative DNA methylase